MTRTIDDMSKDFTEIHAQSLEIGRKLAGSIEMLSIGEVRDIIAKAVVEMESVVQSRTSLLGRIPWAGKYLEKARDRSKEEGIKNSKMTETVDRLFATMDAKNKSVMNVMNTLYSIREHTKQYVEVLENQKEELQAFLAKHEDSFDGQKARNLLAQVLPSIIKGKDHLAIMAGTLNAASQASQTISGMLPALQGELQTELAIKSSMNELVEFKEIFDNTIALVEELNYTNNEQVRKTILEVVELEVTSTRNIERLEKNQKDRMETHALLEKKREQAIQNQATTQVRLENLYSQQHKALDYINKD